MPNDSSCCQPCSKESLYNILKILLILYNIFFALLGFTLVGLGIYSEVMRSQVTEADHVFLTPSVFLFTMGTIVSVFASIGCVGAMRDNICLLRTFNVCIFICILIELGAGVAALVFKEPAKNFVNIYVSKGLVTYYDDHDLRNLVDFVQEEFQCCGGQGPRDWEKNPYHNCTSPGPAACGVPYSCCRPQAGDDSVANSMCGYDTLRLKPDKRVQFIYTEGCITAVIDFLWSNLDILAGVLLGVFLPQMTGIIMAMFYLDILKKIIVRQSAPEGDVFLDSAEMYGFQKV